MAEEIGFQFVIEFDPFGIPPGFKTRFELSLREEAVLVRGLKCYLGALGGNRFTYGFIWRPEGAVTLEDRQRFEEWLHAQPITCKVALGDPEPLRTSDINREVTERVFELDNMSAEDRQAAAEWRAWVFDRLGGNQKEQGESGADESQPRD
jgi:hypothetical protein